MLIEQKIDQTSFSNSQQYVIDYLLKERDNIKNKTIKEISKETYTSTATVMRVAKKLGYSGFDSFKNDFIKEIEYLDTHFSKIDANLPFNRKDNIQVIASKISQLEKETIEDTLSLVEHDSLQQAIRIIEKANTIHLAAISYNLLLGEIFKLDMLRIGKNVNICNINGEILFSNILMNKDDCLIVISYSGEIKDLCTLASEAHKKGVKVIAITSLGDSTLSKYADIILYISTREKLYSKIKGYSNEISIKLILDILYSCYFNKNYEKNLKTRIHISSKAEPGRTSNYSIMKESVTK